MQQSELRFSDVQLHSAIGPDLGLDPMDPVSSIPESKRNSAIQLIQEIPPYASSERPSTNPSRKNESVLADSIKECPLVTPDVMQQSELRFSDVKHHSMIALEAQLDPMDPASPLGAPKKNSVIQEIQELPQIVIKPGSATIKSSEYLSSDRDSYIQDQLSQILPNKVDMNKSMDVSNQLELSPSKSPTNMDTSFDLGLVMDFPPNGRTDEPSAPVLILDEDGREVRTCSKLKNFPQKQDLDKNNLIRKAQQMAKRGILLNSVMEVSNDTDMDIAENISDIFSRVSSSRSRATGGRPRNVQFNKMVEDNEFKNGKPVKRIPKKKLDLHNLEILKNIITAKKNKKNKQRNVLQKAKAASNQNMDSPLMPLKSKSTEIKRTTEPEPKFNQKRTPDAKLGLDDSYESSDDGNKFQMKVEPAGGDSIITSTRNSGIPQKSNQLGFGANLPGVSSSNSNSLAPNKGGLGVASARRSTRDLAVAEEKRNSARAIKSELGGF